MRATTHVSHPGQSPFAGARGAARLLLALAALFFPTRLLGQLPRGFPPDFKRSSYLGVGYVASIPDLYLGVSVFRLSPRWLGGAGLYADLKFTTGSPGNDPYFLPGVTVDQAELTYADMLYDEKSDWVSLNGALVVAVNRDFALYGGAGYSRETHYRQYYDEQRARGQLGFYWISDPDASGGRLNLLGGWIFRLGRYVLVDVGAAARPRGATAGFIFVLPR